jgi:hypothetical protein
LALSGRSLVLALFFWVGCQAQANDDTTTDGRATEPAPETFVLWYRNYDSPAIRSLVQLALDKTPEYGPYTLRRSEELSQGRALLELASGRSRLVDIANVATSKERETELTAIPIPIDGGLLGFRVCVVKADHLPRFRGIRTLAQLRDSGIRIGQGSHWPDTTILRESGLTVITHTRYEILLTMLRNDRFDCFARGISEVTPDLRLAADPNLVIEPNLLIAYPMPSYLFVGPRDTLTAHRLQLGLVRAIEDGSFGTYLDHFYGQAVARLNLEQRRLIVLDNPLLSEESQYVSRETFDNLRRRLDLLVPER